MISAPPLALEVSTYQALRGRLLNEWPEIDEETLADSLEGITDLHQMIAAVIRSALVDEALKTGLRSRLEEMKQQLVRLEDRGAKKRQLALEAMSEVGLKKLEQPDFTASARAGSPALIILAEDKVPDTYRIPQPSKLDRQTILGDLKRGAEIPGAQLSNPQPVLMVRTK